VYVGEARLSAQPDPREIRLEIEHGGRL